MKKKINRIISKESNRTTPTTSIYSSQENQIHSWRKSTIASTTEPSEKIDLDTLLVTFKSLYIYLPALKTSKNTTTSDADPISSNPSNGNKDMKSSTNSDTPSTSKMHTLMKSITTSLTDFMNACFAMLSSSSTSTAKTPSNDQESNLTTSSTSETTSNSWIKSGVQMVRVSKNLIKGNNNGSRKVLKKGKE